MARRLTATVRSCLAAGVAVLTAVALSGVPGEPAEWLAAGPDGVTGGVEVRTDEAVSLRAARETGKPVQVMSLTSETAEVWALPNGSFRAELSLGASRIRRGDDWVPVDLTLQRTAEGRIAAVAHPFDLVVSGAQRAGTHELAALGHGDDRLSIGWSGALPEPEISAERATYADALPGVDLVVASTRAGMETFFVVKSRAAASQVAKMSLPISGRSVVKASRDAGGNTVIQDATGRTVARTPALKMWDARINAQGDPVNEAAVASTVDRTVNARGASGLTLTLTPDLRWLTDPKRQYPITIDPQINPLPTTYDSFIQAGDTADRGGTDDLRLGRLGSTGPVTRSLARWDTTALVGKQITAATFSFWNWWSAACSARSWEIWTVGTVYDGVIWDTQPTWNYKEASSTATAGYDASCNDNWVGVTGTSFFQRAANAGDTRADMGLRASNETDSSYFKQFRSRNESDTTKLPKASVTYNSYPTVTARATVPTSSCVTGTSRPLVNSLTPQLKATVSDADGTAMSVTFEWWSLVGTAPIGSATVTGVGNGATASTTVATGAFADGGSYRWRVKAADGVTGSDRWSSFCEMTVYVTAPPVAGCTGGVDSDFNGDGVADVAIADPEATVEGKERAGQIHIIYGRTGAVQTIDEGNAQVSGILEAGDGFGTSISSYDANRDGCSDLAVGVPYEDIGSAADSGIVYVLLGAPTGLATGPASINYHQDLGSTPDTVEPGDWFGYSVAGSRTASGEPYLVIGVPGEDIGASVDAGLVHYLRGSVNVVVAQGAGMPGAAESDDRTGYSVAASTHHFVVGSPGEAIGSLEFAGSANVLSHTLTGGLPTMAAGLTQDVVNVSNVSEANDTFGKSVSIAPYRPLGAPAGQADSLVVVGVPGEDITVTATNTAAPDAGLVHRFHVTAANTLNELPAITYSSEDGDQLGERVLVVNTAPASESTTSTMFLAVGVPGEDAGAKADTGRVRIFPALANPVGTPLTIERAPASLPGTAVTQELLGTSLGATSQQLYVGSPYGDPAVYGFTWSSLAGGSAAPTSTWKPGQGGIPAAETAFGAGIG
ncbi:hypothetical protein ACFOW4_13235 [Micromonospora sp. GCM10011542]|uniref:hypothetical protein n=1 Tax=Micromonospora sp. GCM10011542 TaxID=3317337 RepID=UPI003607F6AB